jgi:hypothetical protein
VYLDHAAARPLLQLGRCALRDRLPNVRCARTTETITPRIDDRDLGGEVVGFVEVLRREQVSELE